MGYSVGIGLTNDCNLNCAHCYRPTDQVYCLSLAEIETICQSIPVSAMGMGTGENSLHPQFGEIVGYLQDQGIKLTMASNGQFVHLGGSMSIADLMAALFFHFLQVKEGARPRDHFILSKGHAVHAFHACLAELGEIDASEFSTLGRTGTRLAGHPSLKAPLVEFATGSLGHGLSLGIGIALAAELDTRARRCALGHDCPL